ncbi:MAG: AAA family ATPase, partial [Devosiaceae bacterium]|nr:AAA family ATPase [Devosiaceae bacterium MH13]
MKFTKLRIAGFKTFIEPTDLLIDDGLTGVVGPNGCGKSNLVEAMRWAMGESSYKAMRASGMEEVIFSGSAKRPARNWAEVKLFLDNDDRRAPAAFNEHETIEVSRKIERDKGSAYRVNGREARARDIQLMFADAASGARSPSMVRQGQIGEIISAKPVQRRALLEEAAGISGLHTRRHEAELRLKAAEANIERLDDVIAELDRQLDGLRKQARQAARYREIAAKTRTVEAGVYALKWAAANQAANDATRDLAEAKDALARADEAQLSSATAQASAAALVPAAREKAAEAGAALGRLLRARDELASEERRISDRLDSARAQLETLNADIARETGLSEDHTAEKQALDADLAAIRTEVEAVAARQPSLESALEAAQSALTAALAETQTAREALASGRAQREAQAKLRLAAQRDLEETNAKLAAARQALDALKEQLVGADALDAARQKAQETNDAASKAAEAVVAAEGRRTGSMQALAEAEQPLRDAEKALNFTRAEVAALEKLVGPQNSGEGGHTAILDLLEVASGFETALGAALGEALEAATDEAAPAFWRDNPGPGADPALPDGCEPLAAHVSGSPMLARALAQVGLVTDPAQGDVLQTALAAGQLLVSRDGAVWRWDGLVRRAEAPSAAAVKLAERNRLADLRADADAQAATVEALRSAHTEALAALAQADATLNASRSEERAARQQQQEAASAL